MKWSKQHIQSQSTQSVKSTNTSNPDLHHAAIAPKLSLGFASDDHKKSARCPPVGFTPWVYNSWLAVFRLPLWKNWVRQLGLWNSQLIWKVIKKMFQTTNQVGYINIFASPPTQPQLKPTKIQVVQNSRTPIFSWPSSHILHMVPNKIRPSNKNQEQKSSEIKHQRSSN